MTARRSLAPMMFVLCAAGAAVVAQQSAAPPRQPLLDGSGYVREDAYTFGVGVGGDMDPTATGEMGAIYKLTPSMQIIRSPETKHTDGDVPELVPAVGLEAVGRAFAKIIDEVNTLDRNALLPAPTSATRLRAGRG